MRLNGDTNLAYKVHDYIMEMLIKQELKCGEKVPEEKIADMLSVSRTPIREALRMLASEGLVNIYPKRFAEIVTLTQEDIHDIGLARLDQDVMAARLAIYNGSNADFMELTQIVEKCKMYAGAGDKYNSIITDADFHKRISKIGGNPVLTKFQNELYQKICLYQSMSYTDEKDAMRKISHHDTIMKGLINRDAKMLLKSIKEHIIEFYDLKNSKYKFFIEEGEI